MPEQTMTEERLKEIERRANAATPGPWYAKATDDEKFMNARYVSTLPGEFRHDHKRSMAPDECDETAVVAITLLQTPGLAAVADDRWDENTEFIAHAREDIPALISALRAEREKTKRLTEALEEQITYWYQLPSGVDEEADWQNPSPEDAIAHTAGLAVQAARAALRGEKP